MLSSGFPVTMIGQIDLPSGIPGKPLARDDSGTDGSPVSAETGATAEYPLPDGGRIIIMWGRDGQPLQPLRAGVPLILRFRVADRSGNPAQDLEPYMGMAAHATILRSDGSVFAHVHPTGSVPMASFELAQASLPGNLGRSDHGTMDMKKMAGDKIAPEIFIPYGFPKPGKSSVQAKSRRPFSTQQSSNLQQNRQPRAIRPELLRQASKVVE